MRKFLFPILVLFAFPVEHALGRFTELKECRGLERSKSLQDLDQTLHEHSAALQVVEKGFRSVTKLQSGDGMSGPEDLPSQESALCESVKADVDAYLQIKQKFVPMLQKSIREVTDLNYSDGKCAARLRLELQKLNLNHDISSPYSGMEMDDFRAICHY